MQICPEAGNPVTCVHHHHLPPASLSPGTDQGLGPALASILLHLLQLGQPPSRPQQGPVRPGDQELEGSVPSPGPSGLALTTPPPSIPVWPSLSHIPLLFHFFLSHVPLGSVFACSVSLLPFLPQGSGAVSQQNGLLGPISQPHPITPSGLTAQGTCPPPPAAFPASEGAEGKPQEHSEAGAPGLEEQFGPGWPLPTCPQCRSSGEKEHLHLALRAPKLSSHLP